MRIRKGVYVCACVLAYVCAESVEDPPEYVFALLIHVIENCIGPRAVGIGSI